MAPALHSAGSAGAFQTMLSLGSFIRDIRGSRNLALFLTGMALLGIAGGVFETTFNNYLSDVFNLSADARGFLEFPRELPGFLTALFAGALFFLPETHIAAASALAVGAGMIGIALCGPSWYAMLAFMTLWSTGVHLSMPVRSSLGMELARGERRGKRLGEISSTAIAASMVGCAVVWVAMKHLHASYGAIFGVGGVAALIAGIVLARMRMPGAHLRRPKFVWHREYWLYYVLAFLFGARKQIFITFGPWVLVRIFHQPAYIFAQLWIVSAVLGIVFQPLLGRAIDHFGERSVLIVDSMLIFLVCAGYGFSHLIGNQTFALWLLYACYVGDQLLFGVNMARDTYLAKIAVRQEHVAPTLSLGVTINHAVSMSIPALGGLMWMRYGHSSVFLGAAAVAVVMLFFSMAVRVPAPARRAA
ncbi:MFS transporter [bacterium]|nr:MFS transporter [bacterium]